MAPKKTTKNKPLKSHQNYQNNLKLGTPGATKFQHNCIFFVTFCILGPKWAQESSRGLKRLAKGVQKMPKGFQKVSKRHEKDIQKASTRHPNAISKSTGNSIANSIGNTIGNAIANAIGNRRSQHTDSFQARWREGRRQVDNSQDTHLLNRTCFQKWCSN